MSSSLSNPSRHQASQDTLHHALEMQSSNRARTKIERLDNEPDDMARVLVIEQALARIRGRNGNGHGNGNGHH